MPVVFSVARGEWRKNGELRRKIAKASATMDEKDVIMARISDLPAWVSVSFYSFLSSSISLEWVCGFLSTEVVWLTMSRPLVGYQLPALINERRR